MKLNIRAHDLKVFGEDAIAERLQQLNLDGIQLVAYKCLEDVKYVPGSITEERCLNISQALQKCGKNIALIGAYFNPVHSNLQKVQNGIAVFEDYLKFSKLLGCNTVGSETGSYNDDKWTFHPQNRTDEALERVVQTFSHLCDVAKKHSAFVGMEGAFGHVCYDVDRLKCATERIGKDNIKIIFDLYNYLDISNVHQRYDILQHGLETFGKQICVFHIKDCVVENGALKQVGVGKGIFDYDKILSMIAKHNPNAQLVLEGTVGEDIPFAINFLSEKINNL